VTHVEPKTTAKQSNKTFGESQTKKQRDVTGVNAPTWVAAKILKDRNLENEDIFELITNPPEIGAV